MVLTMAVEPEPKQFWMAGAGAKNFQMAGAGARNLGSCSTDIVRETSELRK